MNIYKMLLAVALAMPAVNAFAEGSGGSFQVQQMSPDDIAKTPSILQGKGNPKPNPNPGGSSNKNGNAGLSKGGNDGSGDHLSGSGAQTTTTQGNMSVTFNMKVAGTMTVIRKGKSITIPNGAYFVLETGDKVTLNGTLQSLDGKSFTLKSNGETGFDVAGNGNFQVTSGSLSVTIKGSTGTAGPGQTVKVVETKTRTVHGRGINTTFSYQTVVEQSPKQETTNGGTTSTVSPSAP